MYILIPPSICYIISYEILSPRPTSLGDVKAQTLMTPSHNTTFSSPASRAQFQQETKLQLDETTGPIPFLNPTQATYKTTEAHPKEATTWDLPSNIEYRYTARDNRKGRYLVKITINPKN
jgi:hypothetical protein